MSDPQRIVLVGATGLVGRAVIEVAGRSELFSLIGLARQEAPIPQGARMEMVIAETGNWPEVIAALQPDVLINALGTTWKSAGKDEAVFRAVDEDLVLASARAALEAGASHLLSVSSVGADPVSKNFYLRVKGQVERQLREIGYKRLDILRPGLLKGARQGETRIGESFGKLASPLVDPLLGGNWRKYRSIQATSVAKGALELATRKAAGKFVHDNDGIWRAERDWEKRSE